MTRLRLSAIALTAAAAMLSACSPAEQKPLTADQLVDIFKDEGAASAECRPYGAAADRQLCRLALNDGTARVLIVTGGGDKWATEPCLASRACAGWKPEAAR